MSYDIYGERLRPGHCEVHPHVHEEYPCSLCLSDSNKDLRAQEEEYYRGIEEQYYQQMLEDHLASIENTEGMGI